MATRFLLRPTVRTGICTIYVRLRSRKNAIDVKVSTGLLIKRGEASDFFDRIRTVSLAQAPEEGDDWIRSLRRIKMNLDYLLIEKGHLSNREVRNVVNYFRFEEAIRFRREGKGGLEKLSLNDYIKQYLTEIRTGARMTVHGRNFSRATVASMKVAMEKFSYFQAARERQYDFRDIDMQFYRDYTAWLKMQNFCINYVGKMVGSLKTVIASAEADGIPVNPAYKNLAFKVTRTDVDSIYLTREELDRISALDLSGLPRHYAESRDIFLIGVWTAQRVSDYNHINRKNISTETFHYIAKDGSSAERTVRTIRLIQQKTKKRVVIPCSSELCRILDRYPKEFPTLPKQVINNDMKEIGRMAGITETVEVQMTRGGNYSKEYFSKYELIHTHTARRTGATLMYLSGMNEYDICRITGHSSLKMLEKYIKAGELETVRKLTGEYDYFK